MRTIESCQKRIDWIGEQVPPQNLLRVLLLLTHYSCRLIKEETLRPNLVAKAEEGNQMFEQKEELLV
jgi:hypothetical protein